MPDVVDRTTFAFPFLPLYVGRAVWPADRDDGELTTRRHRHPHRELYLVEGAGDLDIDGVVRTVSGPAAVVVPAGALHQWTITGALSLWVIGLKPGVLPADVQDEISRLERSGIVAIPVAEAATLDVIASAAKRRFEEPSTDTTACGAYVSALVTQLAAWAPVGRPTTAASSLVEAFLESVAEDRGLRRQVQEHADRLGVTAGHLSTVVSSELGASPRQLIEERTLSEARRRLSQSSDSAASLAVALGFADPSQFGRWFKRCTGLSPGAFRRCASIESPDEADGQTVDRLLRPSRSDQQTA